MSSEMAKKRGRPKKVVAETTPIDNLESTKIATIRQKSTKTFAPLADKLAKTPTTNVKTTTRSSRGSSKDAGKASIPLVDVSLLGSSSTTAEARSEVVQTKLRSAKPSTSSETALPSSKIFEQVRRLSSEISSNPAPPLSTQSPISQSRSNPFQRDLPALHTTPMPSTSKHTTPSYPAPTNLKPSRPPPATVAPSNTVPIAALNSNIVSQISARAGARPSGSSTGQLPPNYKSVARKVTMTIVALPIAIVTSWILYERLALGQDPKQLVKPGLALVEEDSSREA